MLKYAKIINEETGLCEVGMGTNVEFYQSLGMVMLDVEQSEKDNAWYLEEKCPHYTPEEEAIKRQEVFLQDFFKVEGYGYYRRQPKGYQSAVESMNVLFNIANVTKGLQAGLIIFYPEPDFYDASQCTEEWLVEHQIVKPAMTLEEFLQLYVAFMTAWNTQEHVNLEPDNIEETEEL